MRSSVADHINARLRLPRRLAHRARQSLDTPRYLGIRHERSQVGRDVGRERRCELLLSRNRKPSCGGRIGGTGAPEADP